MNLLRSSWGEEQISQGDGAFDVVKDIGGLRSRIFRSLNGNPIKILHIGVERYYDLSVNSEEFYTLNNFESLRKINYCPGDGNLDECLASRNFYGLNNAVFLHTDKSRLIRISKIPESFLFGGDFAENLTQMAYKKLNSDLLIAHESLRLHPDFMDFRREFPIYDVNGRCVYLVDLNLKDRLIVPDEMHEIYYGSLLKRFKDILKKRPQANFDNE